MKTIKHQQDFDEWISKSGVHICFVHSPWAGSSIIGLDIFKKLALTLPELNYIIIDNENADSFIYDYLQRILKSDTIKNHTGSWIHGYGECFGLLNGQIIWFKSSISDKSMEELGTIVNLKMIKNDLCVTLITPRYAVLNLNKMNIKEFFSLGELFNYFFRKKDPNRKPDFNLRVMHTINKIAILMFLVCLGVILYRLFIR